MTRFVCRILSYPTVCQAVYPLVGKGGCRRSRARSSLPGVAERPGVAGRIKAPGRPGRLNLGPTGRDRLKFGLIIRVVG
jgi:hypothetical protein